MKTVYFLPMEAAAGFNLPTGVELGRYGRRKFETGYEKIILQGLSTTGTDVVIWFARRRRASPPDRLMALHLLVDAIRSQAPRRIQLVLTYDDYGRANGSDGAGSSLGCRAYSRFLNAIPVDEIVHFDLHGRDNLDGVTHRCSLVSTLPLWAEYLRSHLPAIDCLISPDLGRRGALSQLSTLLNLPFLVLDKRSAVGLPSPCLPLAGRRVFIYDDEIVSGRTLRFAVDLLRRRGTAEIHAGITYGFCAPSRLGSLRSALTSLTLSDLILEPPTAGVATLALAQPLLERVLACPSGAAAQSSEQS